MLLSECPSCQMAKVIVDEATQDVQCDECGATFPFRDHLIPLSDRAKPEETPESKDTEPPQGGFELEYSVDQEVPGLAELLEQSKAKEEPIRWHGYEEGVWNYQGIFVQSARLLINHYKSLIWSSFLLLLFTFCGSLVAGVVLPLLLQPLMTLLIKLAILSPGDKFIRFIPALIYISFFVTGLVVPVAGLLRLCYNALNGGEVKFQDSLAVFRRIHQIFVQVFVVTFLTTIVPILLKDAMRRVIPSSIVKTFDKASEPLAFLLIFVIFIALLRFCSFMLSELIYDEDANSVTSFQNGIALLSGQFLRYLSVLVPVGLVLALLTASFFGFFVILPRSALRELQHLLFGIGALATFLLFPVLCVGWACLHLALRRSSVLAS